MLWLPDVETDRWRLPLSDASAAVLLSARQAGGEPALALARGALEHDAALSLWAACRATAEGQPDLHTSDALARWLMANQGCVLVWPGGIHETPDDAAWCETYRRLSAVSLAVARLARQLAGQTGELAERAYLLGLLHLADRWCVLDGERRVAGAPPAYLDRLSAALREPGSAEQRCGSEAVRYVAQARLDCDEVAALGEYDRLTSAATLTSAALASAARCLAPPAGAPEFAERLTAAKLSAMAEFAAGAGHEINNPIAVICGRAQLLLEEETNPQRRRELAVIHTQAMRVYEMISDMMLFARPPAPKLAMCDVAALARQVIGELTPKAHERQVTMHFDENAAPEVEVDAVQVAVVIRALCENALASVARGGKVIVRVKHRGSTAEPEAVLITIIDNGPGVNGRVLEHLFDPFFSGREAGRGLGMGLAKAWRIIDGHGGRIEVRSDLGTGSTFTVVLPTSRKAPRCFGNAQSP